MPWITEQRLQALVADVPRLQLECEELRHRIGMVERETKATAEELDTDDRVAGRRPPATVKSLIFDIMRVLNLEPVYFSGRIAGYHLQQKKAPEQAEKNGD